MGQVPSTGNALTGSRSPLPSSIRAVTCFTRSGASAGTVGGRVDCGRDLFGHLDLVQIGEGAVDRVEVELDDLVALGAVGLLDGRS